MGPGNEASSFSLIPRFSGWGLGMRLVVLASFPGSLDGAWE